MNYKNVDIEKQLLLSKISLLEGFMKKVCEKVKCLPSFADPLNGNEHVYNILDQLINMKEEKGFKCKEPDCDKEAEYAFCNKHMIDFVQDADNGQFESGF